MTSWNKTCAASTSVHNAAEDCVHNAAGDWRSSQPALYSNIPRMLKKVMLSLRAELTKYLAKIRLEILAIAA